MLVNRHLKDGYLFFLPVYGLTCPAVTGGLHLLLVISPQNDTNRIVSVYPVEGGLHREWNGSEHGVFWKRKCELLHGNGMGIGKCDIIPARDTEDQPPPSKKAKVKNFEDLLWWFLSTAKWTDWVCKFQSGQGKTPTWWSFSQTIALIFRNCAMACRIVCIPGYFNCIWTRFSTAARVLEKRCTSLSTHSVNFLSLLHSDMTVLASGYKTDLLRQYFEITVGLVIDLKIPT